MEPLRQTHNNNTEDANIDNIQDVAKLKTWYQISVTNLNIYVSIIRAVAIKSYITIIHVHET